MNEKIIGELNLQKSENKRLREDLKLLSTKLDSMINNKTISKVKERKIIDDPELFLKNLKKKCKILNCERKSLILRVQKYNNDELIEKLEKTVKKLTSKLDKLEKSQSSTKNIKMHDKTLDSTNPESEIRSLTYKKYFLLKNINEAEANQLEVRQKISQLASKCKSLEETYASLKPFIPVSSSKQLLLASNSKKHTILTIHSISTSKTLSTRIKELESELESLNKSQNMINQSIELKLSTLNKMKNQLKPIHESNIFRSASVQPSRFKFNNLLKPNK